MHDKDASAIKGKKNRSSAETNKTYQTQKTWKAFETYYDMMSNAQNT